MSADLERKVREAAEQALDKKRSLLEWTDNAYLYGDGYRDGYLAAATLREEEIEELRAEVLRLTRTTPKVEEMRARVAELEGMVPKLVTNKEFEEYAGRWWLVATFGHYGDLLLIVPMNQPIPVPETKVNASQQGV